MRSKIKTLTISFAAFAGIVLISGQAMASCTQGLTSDSDGNTCIGTWSLYSNSGTNNTANGHSALFANTIGTRNTASGVQALYANTTGSYNTANGFQALYNNTTGNYNTASGLSALYVNTTGSRNTANGYYSLSGNETGRSNTASGYYALADNTTGDNNTAIGSWALGSVTSGNNNIALGYAAGYNQTTGNDNISIAAWGVATDSGVIRLGRAEKQNKTFIAGIYGTTVTGSAVVVNDKGQLGVASSSRRYKEDIQPMGDVSNRLMDLRPVTFRYKQADEAGNKPIQYGLIAEDVDTAMPELVVRNADGSPETVAYHVLPSLLLNEYQKQQQKLLATEGKLAVTEEKLASLESEMSSMRNSMDRLMAALPQMTKLASAE